LIRGSSLRESANTHAHLIERGNKESFQANWDHENWIII